MDSPEEEAHLSPSPRHNTVNQETRRPFSCLQLFRVQRNKANLYSIKGLEKHRRRREVAH
ncbi:hypothetical protein E2C01_028005 [Portunus trituberculatus]|uniref:Uncharacterized protein n=1 Tax=Portunus trituberculatus TaxID=210409 RepID=A0A5B7EJE0_PORTR|nr:hypothetical protein [Portunus trituberculatus]